MLRNFIDEILRDTTFIRTKMYSVYIIICVVKTKTNKKFVIFTHKKMYKYCVRVNIYVQCQIKKLNEKFSKEKK